MRVALNTITALALCVGVALASTAGQQSTPLVEGSSRRRFAAVAFDYLVLFNPDSIIPVVEQVSAGKGCEFVNLWRTRQCEYSWLRSITNRYQARSLRVPA
jgi:hypothetical protein